MQYLATVYGLCDNDEVDSYEFYDSLHDEAPEAEWPPARYDYALIKLGSVWVESDEMVFAASKGWVELVGRERLQRLEELNAPEVLLDRECDLRCVASQLQRTSFGPSGYLLDNGVQSWVICVEVAPEDCVPPRRKSRLPRSPLAKWLSCQGNPTDIFRSIGSPLCN